VFLNWDEAGRDPKVLGERLQRLGLPGWRLIVITNRGVKVYPGGHAQTLRTDHWRCRFLATGGTPTPVELTQLLLAIADAGLDAVKTENLYEFDGVRGYSQAQGE
jgi:isocitrate dehydrogenase